MPDGHVKRWQNHRLNLCNFVNFMSNLRSAVWSGTFLFSWTIIHGWAITNNVRTSEIIFRHSNCRTRAELIGIHGYYPGTQISVNLLWALSIWLRKRLKYCEWLHCFYYNMTGVAVVMVIDKMYEKSFTYYLNAKKKEIQNFFCHISCKSNDDLAKTSSIWIS